MAEAAMRSAEVRGIDDALRRCGVTGETLGPAEREALDRRGFLVWPAVMGAAWLRRLRDSFESVFRDGPGGGATQRSGTRHVENLVDRDAAFGDVCTHPKVLAAVHHVLRRPFGVFQLSGRDPLPGYGQQGLHADWLPQAPSEPFSVVTAIWLLDDFRPDNGATRVVPGSHLLRRPPPKSFAAPAARHPDQTILVASAGSVVLFNGHVWHSGTRNDAQSSRRVLQCQFVARGLIRPGRTPTASAGHLTPAARYFLHVQGVE